MDDFSEKISELLNNPESLEKIKSIAGSFLGDDKTASVENDKTAPIAANETKEEPKSSMPNLSGLGLPNIDPQLLMKITNFLSKANAQDDGKINLLYSIKPYLSEKRAEKIDNAAQILKLSNYASVFVKDLDIFKKHKDE